MASKSPPRRGRSSSRAKQIGSSSSAVSPTRSQSPSAKKRSRSRSQSPTGHPMAPPSIDSNAKLEKTFMKMLIQKSTDDEEDYKSIKLPTFSDGSEWEAVVFELKINLDKVWKHSKELDIVDYLEGTRQLCKIELIKKADKIIYHAIVTAAKRDSFARKQIMASEHDDAVPQVKRNEGLKLYNLFQSIFLNKSKDQATLPNAQKEFFLMKMQKGESAKDYISRVDKAVSDLAILNERISVNSWLFILVNGLLPEYKKSKDGVLFSEIGFSTIPDVKAKILKEETVLGLSNQDGKTSSSNDMASTAIETCAHCNRKGHNKSECRKLKKENEDNSNKKDKYWCDFCYANGHTTDFCWWNTSNKEQSTPVFQKGKGKQNKGKGIPNSKGKGKGFGKGGKTKGGRGNGNFPAAYTPNTAYYTEEQAWKGWESTVEIEETTSETPDWQDYNFIFMENEETDLSSVFYKEKVKSDDILEENQKKKAKTSYDWLDSDFRAIQQKEKDQLNSLHDNIDVIFGKNQNKTEKNAPDAKSSNCDWSNHQENLLVLLEQKGEDISAWTQNNM